MSHATSPARLRWLAIGLLLLASSCSRSGCGGDDSRPATDGVGRALQAPLSPAVAKFANGLVVAVTPLGSKQPVVPRADEYDVLSIDADADPDSGGAPLTVSFTGQAEGGPPGLRYRWDFGDETPSAHELNVQHTYQQPGDYVATFTVTGPPDSDVEESREINIEVTEEGFDLDIDTDSDLGPAPLKVEFTARLDEDLPGPFYFQWDFGDGARDVSNPTSHVYNKPGEYTASVAVTNDKGQRATRDVEITVDAPSDE